MTPPFELKDNIDSEQIPMKELDEVVESIEKNDNFLNIPSEKPSKKAKVIMTENDELSKIVEGLLCVLPNKKNLFIAQKTCLILQFQKNEEIEEILNFEKYAEKNRLYSMAIPKGSMIRKSYKKF